MVKFGEPVRARIQDGIRKYGRIVTMARQRSLSERDTSDIARAMLGDLFGFDPFFDVSTDVSMRSSADYAVMIGDRVRFLVKVKSVGVEPNATQLLRFTGAGNPGYVDWIVVTNAETWSCYHLGVGPDRHAELVFTVSLFAEQSIDDKIDLFYLLCKESLKEDTLTRYWERMRVLHPAKLAAILLNEEVLSVVRRQIQRSDNYRIDVRTLRDIMIHEVLRSGILVSRGGGRGPSAPKDPACFAYVNNPDDSATWLLPYRNQDGSANAELLLLATSDLSTQLGTLSIPADDLPIVKDRLRRAYHELGVTTEELPDSLRY